MRYFFVGLLLLSFWGGVVQAQTLPFSIEVDDLNIGRDFGHVKLWPSQDGFYALASGDCLYYGTGTHAELEALDCDYGNTLSFLPVDKGFYRVSYNADENLHRLYRFDDRNGKTELLKSEEQLSDIQALSSGAIVVRLGNKLLSINERGETNVLIEELVEAGRTPYVYVRVFGNVALVKAPRGTYVTDGTRGGTVRIYDKLHPWEFQSIRAANNLYFVAGNDVYTYAIGSTAPAELIYSTPQPESSYGAVYGIEAVGDRMMFSATIEGEKGVLMRADATGAVARVRIGEGGPYAKVANLFSNTIRYSYNAGEVLFLQGGVERNDILMSDGTDSGTRVLIGDGGLPLRGRFTKLTPLLDNTVAVFMYDYRTKEGTLYVYNFEDGVISEIGNIKNMNNIRDIIETATDYIFYTSPAAYRYNKVNRTITKVEEEVSPASFGAVRDNDFHYRIKNKNNVGTQMMVFADKGNAINIFTLPAPFDDTHSVKDIFNIGDQPYAVSKTLEGSFHLFRLGPDRASTEYVGKLFSLPKGTDFDAFYEGESGEFYLYLNRHFYRYRDDGVEQLGTVSGLITPDGYLGELGGFATFFQGTNLTIPELGRTIGLGDRTQYRKLHYSPFVAIGTDAYVVRYIADDDKNLATVGLYTGRIDQEGESLALLQEYPMEVRDQYFELPLIKLGGHLLYAVPNYDADDKGLVWHAYDPASGHAEVVEALNDYRYTGNPLITLQDRFYYTNESEATNQLIGYSLKEDIFLSLDLAKGEYLVKVLATVDSTLAVTSRRIINLDSLVTVYTLGEGREFEQMVEVGDELFVEVSDNNKLGFYSFRPDTRSMVPIVTDYDFDRRRSVYRGRAIIGSNVFFIGIRGQQYSFNLYDANQRQFYNVGNLAAEEVQFANGPLVNAHRGEFFYPNRNKELGLELYHFRPLYTHKLQGTVYQDVNGNGVYDETDIPAAKERISARGEAGITTFTDSLGNYTLFLSADKEYEVVVNATECHPASAPYSLRTKSGEYELTHDFSVESNPATSLTPHLASSAIRCGFTVPFWLTVTNDGCQPQSGEVTLELHEEATLVSSDLQPTTESEGTVRWTYPSLAPGSHYQIRLQLKMPDETFTGQEIPMLVHTLTADAQGAEVRDTFRYDDILRCAIDPNDKRSWPSRPEESMSNYTQLDEAITYMIRFQNTGNDTAFTVRLEDKLSDDLDWETLKPLTASHDYRITLREGGNLEVLFPDILLVDSVRNEPESHGFFTFEIMAKEGLDDFTAIENTAGIYFDFNKPVITNTVKNTVVETLDEDGDGYLFYEDCNDRRASVNPGVPEIPNNGIDENCDGVDGTTSLKEFGGRVVKLSPNPTRDRVDLALSEPGPFTYLLYDARGRRLLHKHFRQATTIELGGLPAGIYLLRLVDADGATLSRQVVKL